jgi:hypothetical protein
MPVNKIRIEGVVEQLKISLLRASLETERTSPEAYTLFLQAEHLGRQIEVDPSVETIIQ